MRSVALKFVEGETFVDVLLAVGLILTCSTQLRYSDMPIGPGEVLLVLWLTISGGLVVLRAEGRVSRPSLTFLVFWLLFAALQCVGAATGMLIGDLHEASLVLHDIFAYGLAAALSVMCVWRPNAGGRLLRVAWFVCGAGALLFSLQLANAYGAFALGGVEPWYWNRLRGWSENPNQLGLFGATLLLLALHLLESSTHAAASAAALVFAGPAAVAGHLSKSDTFHVVVAVAILAIAGVKLLDWAFERGKVRIRSTVMAIAILGAPILLVASASLLLDNGEETMKSIIGAVTKDNGEGVGQEADLRVEIWRQALLRGLQAATLGLGPGPHLEIPSSVISGRRAPKEINVVHPDVNVTANFESHNNFLEIFLQAGLPAAIALAWLLAIALLTAYRARFVLLAVTVFGVTVFGLTNVNLRQPIYWFSIAMCLTCGERLRPVWRLTSTPLLLRT